LGPSSTTWPRWEWWQNDPLMCAADSRPPGIAPLNHLTNGVVSIGGRRHAGPSCVVDAGGPFVPLVALKTRQIDGSVLAGEDASVRAIRNVARQ
jgi:hypothetical protein